MSEPALARVAPAAPRRAEASVHALSRPAAVAVPRLELPEYDLTAALALERELGVSHVLAQILVRRGLSDPAEARSFLDSDELHPPSAFAGIGAVLEPIRRHLAAGSRITVHGDYDVDGVCATAIAVRALRDLGGRVDWILPSRTEDGYGLTAGTVDRLAGRGTELLITVDCAITAVEEVARARAAGIDVVVTDHHQPRPDGVLPDCPVLHPALAGYPCPELCATAVAYKLAGALGASTAEADLDLVALATVADLMPLQGENRTLVRAGLRALAATAKPGLRALLDVARCDPSALDAGTLGFRLAPRINAAGRMARADAGVELLLCEDERRALEIARELDLHNAERRSIEERITWEAEAQVAELGDRSAYVLAGQGWHPGVIGIVASRIAERYHRPAVVIALSGGDAGQGSGRSVPGFDLLSALHACSEHLERYGGHRAAAGLTIRVGAVEGFRDALEGVADHRLTADLRQPVERVDAVVCGSQAGLGLAEELERLEPSGLGAPRPRLLIPGARLANSRAMGEGKHARFTVLAGGTRTPAVAFGCGGRVGSDGEEAVDASFRLERNCWNGAVEPRLVLRQTWPCAPGEISVIGEDADYIERTLVEVVRDLEPAGRTAPPGEAAAGRTVLDRRGCSPLATLADARAAEGEVLAVCADVARRLGGLSRRSGGYALISYHALELDPGCGGEFEHLVALDPPAGRGQADLLARGHGFTHWAWGEPELRFAQQMHELEYGLRTHLINLYRALRPLGRVAGGRVVPLLRGHEGDAPGRGGGRPARVAGRMLRVLTELGLVELDPGLPALAIAGGAPTSLERSPAYRVYAQRHEDGRRFLSSESLRPGG